MPSNVRFLDQISLGGTSSPGFVNQSGSTYYVFGNFGINTQFPTVALEVVGDVIVQGNITAQNITGSFSGDGSGLTGIISEWDGTLNGNAQITGSLVVTAGVTGSSFTGSFVGDGSQLTGIATTLNFSGSDGVGSVNLKNQAFNLIGTTLEIETSASGQTLQIGLPDDVLIQRNLTVQNTASFQAVDATGSMNLSGSLDVTGSGGFYSAYSQLWMGPQTASIDYIIPTDINAFMIGPLALNATIIVSGTSTLSII